MIKRLLLYTITIFNICHIPRIVAQPDYTFRPISVTASRLSNILSAETRDMIYYDKEMLKQFPAQSTVDLLGFLGLDMTQRGLDGALADLSLRGGSFEQVLILLDGIRMNDPQTGHFNGDLPVSPSEIERIEILSGHASSLFGTGGCGGVVHIITQSKRSHTHLKMNGGSFGSSGIDLSASLRKKHWHHQITGGLQQSEGHRYDTDFKNWQMAFHEGYNHDNWGIKTVFRYAKKDFGANGFYSPYPSREKLTTLSGQGQFYSNLSESSLFQASLWVKRHDDHFILDITNPSFYMNDQFTTCSGGDAYFQIQLFKQMQIALGSDYVIEQLNSSRMGHLSRSRIGMFYENVYKNRNNWIFNLSMRLDDYSGNPQFNPTFSVAIPFIQNFLWRSSLGRVYREPSFTELYYTSPSNIGNPDIKPEIAWSAETGLSWQPIEPLSIESTLFQRKEENPIDWLINEAGNQWTASNFPSQTVSGISLSLLMKISSTISTHLNYQEYWRSMSRNDLNQAKYGAYAGKRLISFNISTTLPGAIRQHMIIRHKTREVASDYTLMDVRWSRQISAFNLFVDIRNLLQREYEEILGIPMPGRAVYVGGEWGL